MAVFRAVRHISITVERSPAEVYDYAANAENLPRWAKGLGGSIVEVDGEWIASSALGKVKVRFTERNPLGVLDHDVVFESGRAVHNPMRVVPNGTGSELVFTLFRRPGMSEQEFAADANAVEQDLIALKHLLESPAAGEPHY